MNTTKTNKMPTTRDALLATALVYNRIEEMLRQASNTDTAISLPDLVADPVIKANATRVKLRQLMAPLIDKGFIEEAGMVGSKMFYLWNLEAPPFMVAAKQARKAARQPSEPVVSLDSMQRVVVETRKTGLKRSKTTEKGSREIEVVFPGHGITLVIGSNPENGRPSIRVIEH